MCVAVPKPLAQSSFKLAPGSGSVEHVPSAHGKWGFSGE
jgi:hypothetical protein